jgi:hypothetical protein
VSREETLTPCIEIYILSQSIHLFVTFNLVNPSFLFIIILELVSFKLVLLRPGVISSAVSWGEKEVTCLLNQLFCEGLRERAVKGLRGALEIRV